MSFKQGVKYLDFFLQICVSMKENEILGNLVPTRVLGWTSKIFHAHPPMVKTLHSIALEKIIDLPQQATARSAREGHMPGCQNFTDFQKCVKKAV